MFYSRPAGELSRKVHLNGQALGSPVFSWLSMKVSGVALLDIIRFKNIPKVSFIPQILSACIIEQQSFADTLHKRSVFRVYFVYAIRALYQLDLEAKS